MTTKITFYGAAGTVTGANFHIERDGRALLVDCGLTQGEKYCDACNRDPFVYNPAEVEALVVTHAHMDHIGRVPFLVKSGFDGPIYSTPATKRLAEVMFDDAVSILEDEAREESLPPLYERADVGKTLGLWKEVPYREPFAVAGFSARFLDAGHILGSAMVELASPSGKLVITGDLGNSPSPLLRDTQRVSDADYLVMESVYGNREHQSKEDRIMQLKRAVEDIHERKGTLMIPAFSIDRTQLLLYELNNLIESGSVPSLPVFLDSPLGIKVTEAYKAFRGDLNDEVRAATRGGDDVFSFPNLTLTETPEESRTINTVPGPKIVVAGSGMSQGGRILHHERRYLPDPDSILLIVGYQAAGSLGRRLQDGAREVLIHDKTIPVRAEVRSIEGYSAHKDSAQLVEFVSHAAERLKQTFLVMGEPKAAMFLAQRLRDYLGVSASVPEKGESAVLDL